ncbi:NAD(P)H-dependent oxidoreductase [Deinococcus irradiatisoli]|uniref:NAD(P)H-dependent oxidoreductase n=1 Tax=Deinococcus irradiatisoli TaxID=2202254 RepID=A0A2Z3JKY7_9DEIO|nr:NADPH-dependent FMN reductase [Deinococcus irradiatisoli]AWN23950.1 NAD(P)H-dependent oxidoreductase [Deinococcus irradiatisoli]
MNFTVLSTSLSPQSRSRALAHLAAGRLEDQGHRVSFLDLREVPLPAFDDDRTYAHPNVEVYRRAIEEADGVLLALPVYNWATGSGAKNLVELTGSHSTTRGLTAVWFDKVVTFLVAGGLPHSYTAHHPLALGLMTDFKCVLNPYHVYAVGEDWAGDDLNPLLQARLDKTLAVAAELAERLRGRQYRSTWEI